MKLSVKTTLLVGIAFCGISTFWGFYGFIVQFALQALGLDAGQIGFVLSWDSIAALVLLPLFGAWSDKINTKIGKRVPFVIVGTVLALVGLAFFPAAFKYAMNDPAKNMWVFLALLVYLILAMCSFRSPAVSLMPTVTPKPLRSQANSIINLMGATGTILFLVLPALVTTIKAVKDANGNVINQGAITAQQVSILPWITIAIIAVLLVAFLLTVNEPKLTRAAQEQMQKSGIVDEEEAAGDAKLSKSKKISFILIIASIFCLTMGNTALQKMYGLFATETFNITSGAAGLLMIIANVSGLACAIPAGLFSQKLGRRKMILIGLGITLVSYFALMFITSLTWIVYVLFVLLGMGQISVIVNTLVIVVEMSRGSNVGRYTGIYYTTTMSAGILAPIIAGQIANLAGTVNEAGKIDPNYAAIIPFSVVFIALAIIAMFFVKHGDAQKIPPLAPKNDTPPTSDAPAA